MRVILYRSLPTRYLGQPDKGLFMKTLDELPDGTEVDLCQLRFTPAVAGCLKSYYGRLKFVNSEKPLWDSILRYNNSIAELETVSTEYLMVPDWSMQGVANLINTLDNTKVYVPTDMYHQKGLAVVTLICIYRPDVTLELSAYSYTLFDFVRQYWIPNKKSHDAYTVCLRPTLVEVTKKDNFFELPDGRKFSEDLLVSNMICLPREFGHERLVGNSEWAHTAKMCSNILKGKSSSEKMSLLDLVELREV